jgi:hypothetical protein
MGRSEGKLGDGVIGIRPSEVDFGDGGTQQRLAALEQRCSSSCISSAELRPDSAGRFQEAARPRRTRRDSKDGEKLEA